MRIGFTCSVETFYQANINELTTAFITPSWAKMQSPDKLHSELLKIVSHNLDVMKNTVSMVAPAPEILRMVRLNSNVLPLVDSTEPIIVEFYARPDIEKYIKGRLLEIGNLARKHSIRVSFHAPYYVSLASAEPYVLNYGIRTLNSIGQIAHWMGYGKKIADAKITCHLNGKLGIKVFLDSYYKLNPITQRLLVLENTETRSLDCCLRVYNHLPIVLDVFHHLLESHEYIKPNDRRVYMVRDSWLKTGERPVLHYSWFSERSRCPINELPDGNWISSLKKPSRHSMKYPNIEANKWVLSFLDDFDIMCEAGAMGIAAGDLMTAYTKLT